MIKKVIYIIALFSIIYLLPNYLYKNNKIDSSQGLTNTSIISMVPTQSITYTPTPILESNKITLSFVGDILLTGNIENKINQYGADSIFAGVKDVLSSSDICVGNLESSVSERGAPEKNKTYTFRAKPERVKLLKDAGFDVMSLANNHVLDYGIDAFYDTMMNLDKHNILYGGGGKNRNEAYKPVIIEANNKKVALLFYSHVIPSGSWHAGDKNPGVASAYNQIDLLRSIEKIRNSVDIVAVYIHWGKEKALIPENYQKKLAYKAIDKGADLIIGTHTHTLQGFEIYKDKLIAYSLGNFLFSNGVKNTMILNIDIENDKFKYYYIPCVSQNYMLSVITDSTTKNKIDNALQQRSFNVKITNNVIKK